MVFDISPNVYSLWTPDWCCIVSLQKFGPPGWIKGSPLSLCQRKTTVHMSSSCSLSRFLPVWHFQSAQYALTEYPLTFGWLDTFSSGREFIINLHLIGPLNLKHFLEQTKSARANGKVKESHLVYFSPHHTWLCGSKPLLAKSQKETCGSLKSWVDLTPTTTSTFLNPNSLQGNGIFNVSESPPFQFPQFLSICLTPLLHFFFPFFIYMCQLMLLFSHNR